jgi:hypothetical protein
MRCTSAREDPYSDEAISSSLNVHGTISNMLLTLVFLLVELTDLPFSFSKSEEKQSSPCVGPMTWGFLIRRRAAAAEHCLFALDSTNVDAGLAQHHGFFCSVFLLDVNKCLGAVLLGSDIGSGFWN